MATNVVRPIYKVKIGGVDYSEYVTNVNVNHEVQTLSPTFSVLFSKNLPIVGGELFDIEMGYSSTLVAMLVGGTVSTFSRTTSGNGTEFVVNGRGPLAKIIDEGPIRDRIYISTWDKSYSKDGYWVSSSCGIQRTEPVPPGVDPDQDPATYEIFEGEWTVRRILNHIAGALGIKLEMNIPDPKYREVFRLNRTQTWFSGIQQLVTVWEPTIFMRDGTLCIWDTDVSLPAASNIQYGSDSCVMVNMNYTKNNIINRIVIKGGVDESVIPIKKSTWPTQVDHVWEFFGEDLSGSCTEITTSTHELPSSFGGLTGAVISQGYYRPMFGDPFHVYTRTVDFHKGRIIFVKLEVNYFKASGVFGPDQQVCTRVFKTRRQAFSVAGYFTEGENQTYVATGDLYVEKGFVGPAQTGTDASDPQGQSILPVDFGGYSYFKVSDQEEMHDTDTGSFFSTSVNRTFGILPLATVTSAGGSPTAGVYKLVGGVPITSAYQLYKFNRIDGHKLSYRIVQEQVTSTDVKSTFALKQTHTFDYTRMISDYSVPLIDTTSEFILKNQVITTTNVKKPMYQFEQYFEDLTSIGHPGHYGYRPVVTYYDPSIINIGDATVLKNKIFAKSGRMEQEITIQPTTGNPLLSVGKSIVLESATYKQLVIAPQTYEDVTIDGGTFIINGIRHSFNAQTGFKTEVSLRKLYKLI